MTKKKPEIVIFCQAPADVPYVLDLYNKFYDHDISIYVINVKGIFEFISTLNLTLNNLIYISYSKINFKNPFSVINEKLRIKNLKKKYFHNKKNVTVFFFSKFEDWLTSSFIDYFASKQEIIYYINHYDTSADSHKVIQKVKFTRKILGLLFNFISGVQFLMNREFKFPEFPIHNYNIIEQVPQIDENIYNLYSVNFNRISTLKNQVIFFLSPAENEIFDIHHYQEVVLNVLNILNSNQYEIFIKGHPRIGLPFFVNSNLIDEHKLNIIDSYIPGEFIDMNCFDLCIGIDSTILSIQAKKSNINTICLMDLIYPRNINLYNYLKTYLINYSDKKLFFVKSLFEFDNCLKRNKW